MTGSAKLKEYLTRHSSAEKTPSSDHAAVLVPLGFDESSQKVEILLTKRTQGVETHKGQISFPGGYREEHDASSLQTALRETEEELGISTTLVEPLGPLPPVYTRGNTQIFPWVGAIQFPAALKPNEQEVETVLYLPVKKLMVEGLKPITIPFEGASIATIGLNIGAETVWGATARILEHLRLALVAVGY